ncbi:Sporulation initiation inhibitor Soj [Planctomycetales bacterium 10988]|nr:Sporulation initiation inhibitor Soj [Planctomycetales bacterium 10988]
MSRILCVSNQKRGVGKTTTTLQLGDQLARSGVRVLLADLDPQGQLTSRMGISPAPFSPLLSTEPLNQFIRPSRSPNLDLLPSCPSRTENQPFESLANNERAELVDRFREVAETYDAVLCDCPPSLGSITELALQAAEEILIPVQGDFYALEGLDQMVAVIRGAMQGTNPDLRFGGVILTRFNAQHPFSNHIEQEVREFFGEIVFDTVIPEDQALLESANESQAIFEYSIRSPGMRAYAELCMEVIDRG